MSGGSILGAFSPGLLAQEKASGPAGLRSSTGAIEGIYGAFGPWLLFLWTDTFRGDTYMLIIARCTPTLLSARIILSIYGLGMSRGGFFFFSFVL